MLFPADDDGRTLALREAGRRLSRALTSTDRKAQELVDLRDVAGALSQFLGLLRAADARSDGSPRFERDDGIILLAAESSGQQIDVFGYIWWITQSVDPVWARFDLDLEKKVFRRYAIKCGVRRMGDVGHAPTLSGRHLRKLTDAPEPDDIVKAWHSGQLSPELDVWFFDFSSW